MSSRSREILISVSRSSPRPLGRQIEESIRNAIRDGRLRSGAALPSTRDLSNELGVSRPVVMGAYEQLAAEGFVVLRQGAFARVSARAVQRQNSRQEPVASNDPHHDLRPAVPDLSSFPRKTWLKAMREVLSRMAHAELGYTDLHGAAVLRHALTEYLGRVRGVQADPGQIFITSGFVQARAILCRALAARSGATRIAVETPGYNDLSFARQAGMRPCGVPVDEQGMQIARLAKTRARIVMVTPAHQFPTGAVMSGSRRAQLLSWLRDHDALAIEDDYDSEFRYDHAPVGALQGLEPNRVIYAGTASKTLAPALRLGWMVVPVHLIDSVRAVQAGTDYGSPRIEQHSFAHLLKSGEFDRHVRRMRSIYRARRDAMVDALARELPEAQLLGIAAGLHVTVRLPASDNLSRIRSEAQRRGLAFDLLSDYSPLGGDFPPAILLGYARHSEEGITRAVRELAMIVRARRKPA